jgi:hypothetical protein
MGLFGRSSWAIVLPCFAALTPSSVEAQPEPSFRSTCQNLRASVRALNSKPDDYFTIEVAGTLTDVQSDGVLVYMQMCSPPDPPGALRHVQYERPDKGRPRHPRGHLQ